MERPNYIVVLVKTRGDNSAMEPCTWGPGCLNDNSDETI